MLRVLVILLVCVAIIVWIRQEADGHQTVLKQHFIDAAVMLPSSILSLIQWAIDGRLSIEGLIALVLLFVSTAMFVLLLCLHKFGYLNELGYRK